MIQQPLKALKGDKCDSFFDFDNINYSSQK